jgi:hypothetical protein
LNGFNLTEWLNSPDNSIIIVYLLCIVLVAAKIHLRFFKNKKMHAKRFLRKKTCPFCGTIYDRKLENCIKCNKSLDFNQVNIGCYNCGYLGEMDRYSKNVEFWVTILLWGLLIFPAIIYYFLYHNRKICRNCGRMTNGKNITGSHLKY